MKDWFVYVRGTGYIGQVQEPSEAQARRAALSNFAKVGMRLSSDVRSIFDDDEFYVTELRPPLTTGDGVPPPLATG